MWAIIPSSIKDLHTLFKANDKSLFIVGGAVRDFLNSETPKDYDLATDATPEEVISITKDYRTHLHGESFGVVVVYTEDNPEGFEIATFREDVYGDKLGETRNPDVIFSTIDKDVLRRDLTFNALFYDLDKKEIIDLVGGIDDIKNKITRFVGEPALRIKEDPLRILRLFRFATRYGSNIEKDSSIAIVENGHMLSIITKERIWDEIKKAYKQAKSFSDYLYHLCEYGIDAIIFTELYIPSCHPTEAMSLELHFAYLFQENSTVGLLDKMKFEFKMEHDFARTVVFLIDLLNLKEETVIDLHKKKVICGISDEDILQWCRFTYLEDSSLHKAFLKFKPSVKADDLMAKGFKNKALGMEIKRLELLNFKTLLNEIILKLY